jgi:hypothetical protein
MQQSLIWDGAGLELPDFGMAPDADQAAVVWADILSGRIQPGRILVVTDALGQVLFVSTK